MESSVHSGNLEEVKVVTRSLAVCKAEEVSRRHGTSTGWPWSCTNRVLSVLNPEDMIASRTFRRAWSRRAGTVRFQRHGLDIDVSDPSPTTRLTDLLNTPALISDNGDLARKIKLLQGRSAALISTS
jgi:hypothetical protein